MSANEKQEVLRSNRPAFVKGIMNLLKLNFSLIQRDILLYDLLCEQM